MKNTSTSPAKKEFRVYATQIMFQDVTAKSAEAAYRIAEEELCFEPCESTLMLDPVVKDLDADEFIRVGGSARCKTCGSDIEATVNDSNFHEGECGPCEYERYKSQSALLKLARAFRLTCEDRISLLKTDEEWRPDDEREDMIGHYTALLNDCKKVLNSYGNAK